MKKPSGLATLFVCVLVPVLSLTTSSFVWAATAREDLAAKAVKSMEDIVPEDHGTVAIWKIADSTGQAGVSALIDNLEVALVNSRRLKLVDRQKLDLILKEQHFTHSGLVDPATMKRFGEVSGVRAFLYGEVQEESSDYLTVLLKLVSVKTSRIIWAQKIVGVSPQFSSGKTQALEAPTKYDAFAAILARQLDSKLDSGPLVFDFWTLETQPELNFDEKAFWNAIVVALANSKKCRVVDRKTLDTLFQEQNLVLKGIVSKEELDRLAKLWGVDGFLYGGVREATDTELGGTMKAIHAETGEVFYASTIQASGTRGSPKSGLDRFLDVLSKSRSDCVSILGQPINSTVCQAPDWIELEYANDVRLVLRNNHVIDVALLPKCPYTFCGLKAGENLPSSGRWASPDEELVVFRRGRDRTDKRWRAWGTDNLRIFHGVVSGSHGLVDLAVIDSYYYSDGDKPRLHFYLAGTAPPVLDRPSWLESQGMDDPRGILAIGCVASALALLIGGGPILVRVMKKRGIAPNATHLVVSLILTVAAVLLCLAGEFIPGVHYRNKEYGFTGMLLGVMCLNGFLLLLNGMLGFWCFRKHGGGVVAVLSVVISMLALVSMVIGFACIWGYKL